MKTVTILVLPLLAVMGWFIGQETIGEFEPKRIEINSPLADNVLPTNIDFTKPVGSIDIDFDMKNNKVNTRVLSDNELPQINVTYTPPSIVKKQVINQITDTVYVIKVDNLKPLLPVNNKLQVKPFDVKEMTDTYLQASL